MIGFNSGQSADGIDGIVQQSRVAGAGGKQNSIRFHFDNLRSGGGAGDDGDRAAALAELPQNIIFQTAIKSHDFIFRSFGFQRFYSAKIRGIRIRGYRI